MSEVLDIATQFAISGELESSIPWGDGHINRTYRVKTTSGDYILQHINTTIFKDVASLMNNIKLVTEHLARKGKETLEIIPTRDGKLYYEHADEFFRMYRYIDNSLSYSLATSSQMVRSVARTFGQFQNDLADFDATLLAETIPFFHHTPTRYQNLLAAVEKDAAGRVADVEAEIAFFTERAEQYSHVTDLLATGEIPSRVTHNDTKINNILLDADSGAARAVIDLDTVMPGSLLYDFGDALRTGAALADEDEKDTAKVGFGLELYTAYCQGFIPVLRETLTPAELDLLAFSVKLMTAECGMRFLTDYIDGDIYFATAYSEHNLVRARNQIALVADIERKYDQMRKIATDVYNGNDGDHNGHEEK
ncbi:phosphotransferase enzyme family protein [Arcanobacterium pinnipediorum]|uniref:Aminoglycoside phosphotransferase family protein n=1 Tax=Arcanobacterium pinnipediorum TaxID=1503041 RepID=A0ABY5AHM0_9ACTO|nr:aminoglycoside phosphotransferase family protein [Arcanobacterium pinnipediorum]USR79350.1 aminoglycoside phosphotransferase family protein [Arcanobacterium pinnipediorum]